MRAVIHADGCSLGNPGPAGLGAHLLCSGHTREIAEPLGQTTNNVAEYSALIRGLEEALDMHATEAEVYMDSELVVRQMTGRYKVKHENIKPLFEKASALAKKFRKFSIKHVPRERNAEADRLSKIGAGMPLKTAKPAHRKKAPAPAETRTKPAHETKNPESGADGSAQGSLF